MTKLFASRLHRLREKAGIPQKELAIALKVTSPTLSNYENGIYLPPLNKAVQMSHALHTSLDYLCGLTDTNFDRDLLNKDISPGLTCYQLTKQIAALPEEDQSALLLYMDFLKHKRQHQRYLKGPHTLLVADEENC